MVFQSCFVGFFFFGGGGGNGSLPPVLLLPPGLVFQKLGRGNKPTSRISNVNLRTGILITGCMPAEEVACYGEHALVKTRNGQNF